LEEYRDMPQPTLTRLFLLPLLALALLALGGAFSNQSERLVELVSAEVP